MSIFSRRSILSRFVASVPALAIAGSVAPAAAIEAEGLTAPSRDRALMVLFSQFEAALAELKAARENKASAQIELLEGISLLGIELCGPGTHVTWCTAEAGTEQPVEVRNIRKSRLQRDI